MGIQTKLKNFTRNPAFPAVAILVVIVILNAILQKNFFTTLVMNVNLKTFTPLILISIGQAVIILGSGIDLSVGSQVSLINVIMAVLLKNAGADPWLIIGVLLLTLAVALGMGFFNGFVAGYLKLPPMIATFATSAIWLGLALIILPSPGGAIPYSMTKVFNWSFSLISTPLIIVVLAYLLWELIKRRPLGHYIYAVGSNEEAAYANGINTRRIKLLSYVLGSFFVLLGAYAITFQAASGDARLGLSYSLKSVAAVVIGGVALKGGTGNVGGAVLGAIVLPMVINLIFFANIPSEYQEFTKGLIIILALALAVFYRLRETRRVTA